MFENRDFYPTPAWLIDKMLGYVDLQYISSILEPSGGSGNILDRIQEKSKSYTYHKPKLFTIEKDPRLIAILKDKGYKVLHNDFLSFDTYSKYSLIIANPPFSEGDKHLLKMIDMQERSGGKIVCLLNAETIKNPYSNNRKFLAKQLEKHNAKIEFIQDAFIDAERKTSVETVLIYMDIKQEFKDSVIIDHLKKAQEYESKQKEANHIVSGDFIERIIQQYQFEIKAGVELINEYNSILPMLSREFDGKSPILKLSIDGEQHRPYYDNIQNEFIRKIRYKYWTTLLNSKEFSQLMTNDIRTQYHNKLEELQEYDFTKYNIDQIRLDIQHMLSNSLQQTIYKMFDDFTRYSYSDEYKNNIYLYNGWKSNSAYKINESRLIIPLNAYDNWNGKFYPTQYTFRDRLRDIYKVFGYLDSGRTILEDDLDTILKKAQEEGQTKSIDCGYFRINTFKKGTTHFEWTRKDLIQKLNIEGCRGKGWLPPSYGKPYNSMTQEEKDVIDSFQGKEEYEEIIQDKSFYLSGVSGLLAIGGS